MEEEFKEFEKHSQDVIEQYQDYPHDYDYWHKSVVWTIQTIRWMQAVVGMHD